MALFLRTAALLAATALTCAAQSRVGRYDVFEISFEITGNYDNPYTQVTAEAQVTRPGGTQWSIRLFWDGGKTFRARLSPDVVGRWSLRVKSNDAGLNGKSAGFECVESKRAGGLRVSRRSPGHFERQNGDPFWFMGDTAWGYFTDSPEDKHHRPQAEYYAKTRASQGFNVIHCMMMSEQGVGNNNGPPFEDIGKERINPRYWQEADARLKFANQQGLTVGMALAWGDKRKVEPFAWRKFPNVDARKRYASYIAARYSAHDVYFLVSGEWHGEVRTRDNAVEDEVFREFVSIGDALAAADPHDRMIGIHPMSRSGSVREFNAASWMSFADYQQNYRDMHARVLLSKRLGGPVVNAEYGYHLRDGDGQPDKSNSFSAEDMRFSSWDIVLAGGYLVTGFGTTYFAGHRDPGPFDVDAPKNDDWEAQIGHIRKFFTGLQWWKLIPADELIACSVPRGADRRQAYGSGSRRAEAERPPALTYWAMATPGETYLLYVRGTREELSLDIAARPRNYRIRQYNPRSGEFRDLGDSMVTGQYKYSAPDEQDWLVLLEAVRTK